MPSSCDPEHAPVGDVGAVLMLIDSRLQTIYGGKAGPDPEQRALTDQFLASMGRREAEAMLDGACTLIFMFMQWLCMAYEDHGEDAIEIVVPNLVASMRRMPRSVSPAAIPTMAGLLVAAGTGLSPALWRKRYGDWTRDEMTPLEATALLLAEHIDRITENRGFAVRMIAGALPAVEDD